MKPDHDPDAPETSISFATWQERQLSILLARSNVLGGTSRKEDEALTKEIARAKVLLETRERDLDRLSRERETLQADIAQWQSKANGLGQQLDELNAAAASLQAREQGLRDEAARLQQAEQKFSNENQTLTWRADSSAVEAADLERRVNDLQASLSWKLTAPLRAITKPLFRMVSAGAGDPTPTVGTEPSVGITPSAGAKPDRSLNAILPQLRKAKSIAIIPCAIPFSATLNQRPISCARYLADHGITVLYVAWQWQPDEEVPKAWEEVYPRVFHLPLFGFLASIETIAAASQGKGTYLCTLPSPALVDVALPLRAAGYHIHYDIMDDWEGFHSGGEAPWFSAGVEYEMVNLADTVSAVSDRLAEKFGHLRRDIAVVRNGYQPAALDCEQFIAARTPLPPRKVVGYFGHFSDAWFYWDTVIYAAEQRPDIDFELIGWGISDATKKRLSSLPNIRPVGIVPQKDLHRRARNWWLGMIPFQPTAVSAAVDPLKVYEYLHLGLPTVVTGISGIANYPLVEYAGDRESFVAAIDRVAARPGEQKLAETAAFLKDCVWDERFSKLSHMLSEPAGLTFLYAR